MKCASPMEALPPDPHADFYYLKLPLTSDPCYNCAKGVRVPLLIISTDEGVVC